MPSPTNKKSGMSVKGPSEMIVPAHSGGGLNSPRSGKSGLSVGVGDKSIPASSGSGLVPSAKGSGSVVSPQDKDV